MFSNYKYVASGIIHKNNQAPIDWKCGVNKKITKIEAIAMLDKSHKDSYGHGLKNKISLENFKCVRV